MGRGSLSSHEVSGDPHIFIYINIIIIIIIVPCSFISDGRKSVSQSVSRSVGQSASPEQEVVKSTLALGGFDTSRGRDGGRVLGKKTKKQKKQ